MKKYLCINCRQELVGGLLEDGRKVGGCWRSMKRFYTLPDADTSYPYLLVNRKNYKILFQRKFSSAIIDSGVMDFIHEDIKDYPLSFLSTWGWRASQLSEVFKGKAWFVIPDYPDDYHPGQFGDNVSKTIDNIDRFLRDFREVAWLPVIQSRYLNRLSFSESCQRLKAEIPEYPQFAIGTVCKCKNHSFIEYCCKTARKIFPHAWLHAFGLTLSVLPKVVGEIDSFDSMAWTFPRNHGGHSCRSKKERQSYFNQYMVRLGVLAGA